MTYNEKHRPPACRSSANPESTVYDVFGRAFAYLRTPGPKTWSGYRVGRLSRLALGSTRPCTDLEG